MQSKTAAFLEKLHQVKSFDDLQRLVADLRAFYQIEHLAYHSINSLAEPYAVATYSPEWAVRYFQQGFSRIDPVVLGCFQRFHPVEWKSLDWSGKAARAFLLEARNAGVGSQGMSVPIRGPNGQFALFTANHNCSDEAWAQFTTENTPDLILIAHYLNQKALEIERGTDFLADQPLSPREIDTLTLLGRGKSRAHAACILSISEHTLRAYIESARFKLGAVNTVHAVALAITRGKIAV